MKFTFQETRHSFASISIDFHNMGHRSPRRVGIIDFPICNESSITMEKLAASDVMTVSEFTSAGNVSLLGFPLIPESIYISRYYFQVPLIHRIDL